MTMFDGLVFAPKPVLRSEQNPDGMFVAHRGKGIPRSVRGVGKTPYVGAARDGNSIVSYIDADPMFPGGWLTLVCNGNGGAGQAKYQPHPFWMSIDALALEPVSEQVTEAALLIAATSITKQFFGRFGFGDKLNVARLSRQSVMVPVTPGGDVDWDGMNAYGTHLLRQASERALEGFSQHLSGACHNAA